MNGAENSRMTGTRQLVNGSPVIPTPLTVIQDGTVTKVKGQQIFTAGNAIMSNKQVGATASPIAVPMQAAMQIVNVRPNQSIQMTQARGIAPRMLVNQISGVRPNQPGQPLTIQSLPNLPAGTQGHIIVKTDTGQYQLVRVNASGQLPANGAAVGTGMVIQQGTNNAFRIQPQTTNSVNTLPISTSATSQMVQNIIPTSATATSSLPQTALVTASLTNSTQVNQTQSTPTVGTQTVSAESAKSKCKNFLSTLLRLASDQRATVAKNVYNLIQGLIDGEVEPEVFTEELQRDLNSNPQPCLVPFLKKTLPYLRASLAKGELSIDGVRPPPLSSVQPVTGMTTVIPSMVSIVRSATPASRVVNSPTTNTIIHRPATPQATNARLVTSVQQLRVGGKIVSAVKTPTMGTPSNLNTPTLNSMASPLGRIIAKSTKDDKKAKDKNSNFNTFGASSVGDDDINDVAAMGGVNLGEESQRILESTGFVGTHIRSCKDDIFLSTNSLHQRVKQICTEHGMDEPSKDVLAAISHATQERLKCMVQKLGIYAEHRLDLIKSEPKYEVVQDVKSQLRFLEDLHKVEKKRKDEQDREILLRAAKSRNRTEDPEQAKLKAKAKEMQRVEMEEMRQRDANLTALKALQGPRKRQKLDNGEENATFSGTFTQKTIPMRPRIKRVNMRDMIFLLEQDKDLSKSHLLYRTYLK